MTRADAVARIGVLVLSAAALGLIALPLTAGANGAWGETAVWVAVVGIPVVLVLTALVLDGSLHNTVALALVGILAALAATARVVSTGVGGFEFVFVVVILAGRALGARLGFLVGVLSVGLSSAVWGGFGPWTAVQMMALGWVGAGAGLLPRISPVVPRWRSVEVALLATYGAVASYVFGLVMNLWFWPVVVGSGTSLSFVAGEPFLDNASRFLLFSLTSSVLTWDTVRAITTVIGIVLVGAATLQAIRRAYSPVPPATAPANQPA